MKHRSRYVNSRNQQHRLQILLREAGYSSVTKENCTGYVCNIVEFFAGANPEHQREVYALCVAALGLHRAGRAAFAYEAGGGD